MNDCQDAEIARLRADLEKAPARALVYNKAAWVGLCNLCNHLAVVVRERDQLRSTVADLTAALEEVLAWRDSSETGQAVRADAFEVLSRVKEVKP